MHAMNFLHLALEFSFLNNYLHKICWKYQHDKDLHVAIAKVFKADKKLHIN